METLTLARYVLEMSLMEYEIIEEADSRVAAAALLLALRMKSQSDWVIHSSHFWCSFNSFRSPIRPKLWNIIQAIKKKIS